MILFGKTWEFIEPANWKTSLLECFMHCLHTALISSSLSLSLQRTQNAFTILHIRMHPKRYAVHNEHGEENAIENAQN